LSRLEIVIRNARTLEHDNRVDIAIEKTRIAIVKPSFSGKGAKEIDARGCLVLPTFVEPHVHLDKALLAERMPESRTIQEARERIREAKKSFTVDDVIGRARRVADWALVSGVTCVRSHVDVDNIVRLMGVKALSRLRKELRGLVDIQIVAFPQEGIVKSPGVSELLERALEEGAGVVGGIPEVELTREDSNEHTETVTSLAVKADVDVDVHCDVSPSTNTVEHYAAMVMEKDLQGRATADHLISLSYLDDARAAEVVSLLKKAMINVVVNPCTMMVSGSSDRPPLGRGVTRIKEIVRAGINFSYGLDNMVDPYNPFGDFDTLRNGWLLAYEGQLSSEEDMVSILKMNTYNAARTLRLPSYGMQPGCYADLNVLDAQTPRDALRRRTLPLFVIKRGEILVENRVRVKRAYRNS